MRQPHYTKIFHIRLTPELFSKVEAYALAEGYSSVAALVREVMTEKISANERQR